jgi:hypothetical protein
MPTDLHGPSTLVPDIQGHHHPLPQVGILMDQCNKYIWGDVMGYDTGTCELEKGHRLPHECRGQRVYMPMWVGHLVLGILFLALLGMLIAGIVASA